METKEITYQITPLNHELNQPCKCADTAMTNTKVVAIYNEKTQFQHQWQWLAENIT